MNSIRIIVTGGTFDKSYDEIKGTLTFRDSHLPSILEQMRLTLTPEIEINQLVDSLDMQEGNRLKIGRSCKESSQERILITHGTDTMVLTARYLASLNLKKTILLTGAMIPYAVSGSDALFNLGTAFSAVQILPHGVYIAMCGQVFPWDKVEKNREKGVFQGEAILWPYHS